jgi:hypothetical protein
MNENLLLNIDVFFRIANFIVVFVGGLMGLSLWYNRRINHLSVSKYWRLFITGIIFYAIGTFSDIFTPSLRSSLGFHNLLTESSYMTGLSLIFISLYRFISDYVLGKTKETKINNQ